MKQPSAPPLGSYSLAGPGTRLNGIYVIDRLIAVGGMGQVYVGHTIETGDRVAIKMIRPELAQSDTHLGLFRKEAAALHRTLHDAIVRYYLFTTDPDLRCPYLAMEFVEGESLGNMLERGPLDLDAVRTLQRRVAAGLDVAHRAGVVHRDVSPDNIILPGNDPNRAKIIDFGIARDAFGGSTLIGDDFAGKSNYVSPEQIGLFGGEVTTKSDIYSFGLTLAAALLGRPLDMGGLPAEMVRKRSNVPDLSDIPAEMRPLLRKMLQPRPEDRPASMAEVAFESAESAPKPAKGGRWILPAVGAAVVVAIAGVGLVALRGRDAKQAERPQPAAVTVAAEDAGDATKPARESALAPTSGVPASLQPAAPPSTETPPAVEPPVPNAKAGAAEAPPEPRSASDQVSDPQLSELRNSAAEPPEAAQPGKPASPLTPAADSGSAQGAFRDCDSCPELVALPAGVFAMGGGGDLSERPIRRVSIASFAIGRFPVTEGEWRLCVAAQGCSFDPGGDPHAPVHNLSWDDALQYVDWLSALTGRRYHIPSEAEWEYAARAGAKTKYWWGDQFKPDMSPCRSCGGQSSSDPPAVGRFPANAFGLHDVTGSVSQWVADCWHKNYRGAPADGSAWTAPACPLRVLRGGSWTAAPADLRVANREFYDPKVRYPGHGLRVAREP